MTSTLTLESKPGSTYTPSTAPDVGDEKESARKSRTQTEPDEYPTGPRLIFIVLALVLSIFLVCLDLTIVATAIPKITDEFHGLEDVSWYSSASFMTIGGFQSAWGKAYKYFPLKTSFLISIFIFELGSLIGGVAPNSTALIVGRAIAGLGAAGIGSGTYTINAFSAGPKRRPMFTGTIGTSYGIAAVVGPLFAGHLRIRLAGGGVSISTSAKPKSATFREKLLQMDPVGVVLVMGAVISYIVALCTTADRRGGPAGRLRRARGCLCGLRVVPGAQGDGAVPPRWGQSVPCAVVFAFFFSGAYFLIIYYLLIYFQSIDNVSPTMSGVRNLPLIISVTISMLVSGAYISITGIAAPIIVAGAAIGTVWIGYQIIGGVGWGIASQTSIITVSQTAIITVQATAPAADLAEVTAILLFFQTVGGAFMVSASQAALSPEPGMLLKPVWRSIPSIPRGGSVEWKWTLRGNFAMEWIHEGYQWSGWTVEWIR
ncbi:major facilitator superfamily domain-containing protein [Lipomyces starkeyi]